MADPWHYERVDLARGIVDEFDRGGVRALTIFAERGIGKTEFLRTDLARAAMGRERVVVYLDIWGVRDEPALGIGDRLRDATRELVDATHSKRELTGASLNVLGVGGSVTSARRAEPDEPDNALSRIVYWAGRLSAAVKDRKILLLIDEVQALATHEEGTNVTSSLRAAIQTHHGRFEPVFTGSNRDRLLMLFKMSKAPLFNFADEFPFPPLDERFANFVAQRAKDESGLTLDIERLRIAFEALGRKPGSLVGLVKRMQREGQADLTAALAQMLEEERALHLRAMELSKLRVLDRAVLAAIAGARPVFGEHTRELYAAAIGLEKVSRRAVELSLARLREQQFIYLEGRGNYRLENSALATWLEQEIPELATTSIVPRRTRGGASDLR